MVTIETATAIIFYDGVPRRVNHYAMHLSHGHRWLANWDRRDVCER